MTAVRAHARPRLAGESGFTIVEVLATALVVLILAAGAFGTFDASSKATGRAKARSVAMTLAQSDQERMRALPIEQLANLRTSQTRTQQLCDDAGTNCITYTIASQADWVKDGTGVQSCTSGTSGFDYLKLTSTVTWPNIGTAKPLVSESIFTPPPGTFGANQGAIAVKIVKADGTTPVQGATVSLAGTKNYQDVTNAAGCVFWGVLPVGNAYTVTAAASGYVTADGGSSVTKPASVIAQSVNTLTLQLDQAASATLRFVTKDPASNTTVPETLDQATLVNAGMTARRVFGTAATSVATVPVTGLFPFTTGYQIYGGGCVSMDPTTQSPADTANLQYLSGLIAGADRGTVDLALPAFDTKVRVATNATFKGGSTGQNMRDAVSGDAVRFRILQTTSGCSNPSAASVQSAAASTTYPSRPDSPGYPYGTYTFCAEAKLGSTVYRQVFTNFALNSLNGVKVTSAAVGSGSDGAPASTGVINITANVGGSYATGKTEQGTCNAAF